MSTFRNIGTLLLSLCEFYVQLIKLITGNVIILTNNINTSIVIISSNLYCDYSPQQCQHTELNWCLK